MASPIALVRRTCSLLGCSLVLLALAAPAVHANPGSLDIDFSDDGRATTDFASEADEAYGVAVQYDGRVVTVGKAAFTSGFTGNFGVARYLYDGELDETFAEDGTVAVDFADFDRAEAVALQADGKIVVVGSAHQFSSSMSDFALTRLNPDGTLDTGFGEGGKRTTDFDGNDQARAVAIQSDGKIVTAGVGGAGGEYFALARYTTEGNLDPTFGTDGRVLAHVPPENGDAAYALAIQPDGKILAAGYAYGSDDRWTDMALLRFTRNGVLDDGFGTEGDGRVRQDVSAGTDVAYALAVEPDGDIVVAGGAASGGWQDNAFAILRYKPDGKLDTKFSGDGMQTTQMSDISDYVHAVAPQTDGKIVAIGRTPYDFALARYKENGDLDPEFGERGDGLVFTDFGAGNNHAYAGAMANDGRIVAAGFNGSNPDFAVARYVNDGLPARPGSPAPPSDPAVRFAPRLYFDSSERWRPLDVPRFLTEDGHKVCPARDRDGCRPVGSVEDLTRRAGDWFLDVNGDRGLCAKRGLRDCDSGPASRIYVNRPAVPPSNGYDYLDYWFYYRHNDARGPIWDHEGDWEGALVAFERAHPERFHYVALAQHDDPLQRLYYQSGLLECGSRGGKCGRPSNRVNLFVANGTHATYPTIGGATVTEGSHDGKRPWGNIDELSAITPLPPRPGWAYWSGLWGTPVEFSIALPDPSPFPLPVGTPPFEKEIVRSRVKSPGLRPRWEPKLRSARLVRSAAASGDCSGWFAPDIAVTACNPGKLRVALRNATLDEPGEVSLRTGLRGARSASAPGIAQLLAPPLRPGQGTTVAGTASAGTTIFARAETRKKIVVVRFDDIGRAKGRSGRLSVSAGRAGPVVRLRRPDGRVVTGKVVARASKKRPARPRRVRIRRRGARIVVRFTATASRTALGFRASRGGATKGARVLRTRRGKVRRVSLAHKGGRRYVELASVNGRGLISRSVLRRLR